MREKMNGEWNRMKMRSAIKVEKEMNDKVERDKVIKKKNSKIQISKCCLVGKKTWIRVRLVWHIALDIEKCENWNND